MTALWRSCHPLVALPSRRIFSANCVDDVFDNVASVRFKSLVYDPQRPDALEHDVAVEEVEFVISSERGEVGTLRLIPNMQTLDGEGVLHIDAYDPFILRGTNGESMSVILVSDDGGEIMRLAIAQGATLCEALALFSGDAREFEYAK